MADNHECPNCGNLMKPNESCCKYCGSGNPAYKPTRVVDNFLNNINLNSNAKNNTSTNANKTTKTNTINWLLAIILLFCCWPVGLIYIIIKLLSK